MAIPTEPIGSIPRPRKLIDAYVAHKRNKISRAERDAVADEAARDTLKRFEDTGSPVVTDGEQGKFYSFADYTTDGNDKMCAGGFNLQFADGHARPFPLLTAGPFKYRVYADQYLEVAQRYTRLPVKQAVISASFQTLFYPERELPDYPRARFIDDLLREHETEIRRCLDRGAHAVQVDFTEGRTAVKLDPSGALLRSFIGINNLVLDRFTPEERQRIGVHTCPGGDCDSTHSADVDYADLLPSLFQLNVGAIYMQLASEPDRERVLAIVRRHLRPKQRVFVGVIDPLDPEVETPAQVCERVLEAARFIPPDQLGTTDDCGFSPFISDYSTSRDTAFAKIRARIEGTALAARHLGL